MSKEDKTKNNMYRKVAIDVVKSAGLATLTLTSLLYFMNYEFAISTPSLAIGVIGSILIFISGVLTSDASGRWGAHNLPTYKTGALLQSVGLGFTVFALIVK